MRRRAFTTDCQDPRGGVHDGERFGIEPREVGRDPFDTPPPTCLDEPATLRGCLHDHPPAVLRVSLTFHQLQPRQSLHELRDRGARDLYGLSELAGRPRSGEPHVVHRTDQSELWMVGFLDPDGNNLLLLSDVQVEQPV